MNTDLLSLKLIAKLWKLSVRAVPYEACGVIVGDDEGFFDVLEFRNYAPKATEEFWMNPRDLAMAQVRYLDVMIWHSHPNARWTLGSTDKKLMYQVNLPMVVVAWKPRESVSLYGFHGQEIITLARYDHEGHRLRSYRKDPQREILQADAVQPSPVA